MMPAETIETDLDWTRLQGRILEGGYQLETILSADAVGAAFKVRVLGDASANAAAKMFGMDASDAAQQAELWQSTRELNDRNLLTPFDAGHIQIDGATVAYLIVRRPDEVLEEVIPERALDSQEAGEVLLAAIGALEELHSHGFVHGSVSPENIVAVEDSVKLSIEPICRAGVTPRLHLREPRYRAPESGPTGTPRSTGQNLTPENDVWCLGATLIEILSQQSCGEDCMEQAAKLPEPFDSIARPCLDPDPQTRPKLGQVEAMFRAGATVAPGAEAKKPEMAAAAAARPPVPASPLLPRRVVKARAAQIIDVRRRSVWIYAAVALACVLALIWIFRLRRDAVEPDTEAAVSTAGSPSQPNAPDSSRIQPANAETATPPTAQTAKAPTAAGQEFVNGPVWRVVIYTYARSADAESKARWVNEKYPGLNAETFSPSGESLYLVTVGGQMNREEAESLRQRVRALGLPRDSYIQNYQQ